MDDEQFQQLIAKLKNASSRRDAVKGLVTGALVSVGVLADPPRLARSQSRCRKNGKNCVEAQNLQYTVTGEGGAGQGGAGNQRRGRRRRRD